MGGEENQMLPLYKYGKRGGTVLAMLKVGGGGDVGRFNVGHLKVFLLSTMLKVRALEVYNSIKGEGGGGGLGKIYHVPGEAGEGGTQPVWTHDFPIL